MHIIDRYILKLFFKVLLICFFSLTGLFIVIDTFGHLDKFLSQADQQGGVLRVLGEYYGARTLTFFDRTSSLLIFIAAMFAVNFMQRTNEMTALMAAGIQKHRVIIPLVAAGIFVTGLAATNREIWIPKYREKLTRDAKDWQGKQGAEIQPRFDHISDILIGGHLAFRKDQRIERAQFGLPPALASLGSQIVAETAHYQPSDEQHAGGYLLTNVDLPKQLLTRKSVRLGEQPVILTPVDTPWLMPNQCFIVSDVSFDELTATDALRQFSSTRELIRGLHNPSLAYGADARVIVHSRFVQPLLDMTLLLIGLPIVLTRENRNIFVAAGWGILLVAGFFAVVIACHALGANYLLNPTLAAWLPLLIFGPITAFSIHRLWE